MYQTGFSPRGESALHVATQKGDLTILKTLLNAIESRPQDINVCDKLGYTPVYYAFPANR